MVSIKYEGRFGNNLFQFATAKVIADQFGLNISNPFQTKILPHENNFDDDDGNNVTLDGFFQNQKITNSFSKLKFIEINNHNNTFIHVRLGDLLEPHSKKENRFMDQSYYENAMGDNLGGFISSDSPDHPIVQNLIKKFNLNLFSDSPENTIIFAAGCSKKILSLGTFSWWIGYLGNQNNVICPDFTQFPIWHGNIFPQKNWNVC